MKSILKSLAVIAAVASVSGGATYSYFCDTAEAKGNTFSTGKLEIGIGHPSRIEIRNAQPGTCETKEIKIENTGTLTARDLEMTVEKGTFDRDRWMSEGMYCPNCPPPSHKSLCDVLDIKVYKGHDGRFDDRSLEWNNDHLGMWDVIPAHQSEMVKVKVCFPNDEKHCQNEYQEKTCSFDIKVDAKAYEPEHHIPGPWPN